MSMSFSLPPWHGCLLHNRNHCPECQSCDCFDPPEKENTMPEYTTRPLTGEESERLLRKLTIALGASRTDTVLQVLAEAGVGIFVAEEVTPTP